MKIFLDTANINEIKEGLALGMVDGVTTNPSLAAKEKKPFRPLVEEIVATVPGDVSLEVVATQRVVAAGAVDLTLDHARFAPLPHREAAALEHRENRRVLGEHVGLQLLESALACDACQMAEQPGRDPASLDIFLDHEREL